MTVAQLDAVQNDLENSSTVAQNLSAEIGKIRNMMYGVNSQGMFTPAQVAQEKTKVKTDIANLIIALQNINNRIV